MNVNRVFQQYVVTEFIEFDDKVTVVKGFSPRVSSVQGQRAIEQSVTAIIFTLTIVCASLFL